MYKFKINYQKGGNILTNLGLDNFSIQNLKKKFEAEKLQTLKVKKELEKYKIELNKLNEDNSAFDLVKTNEDIKTLENVIFTTKNQLEEKENQLKEKENQLKTLGAEISTIKNQLKEKDNQLKTLNSSVEKNLKLKGKIESITNKIKDLEKILALEEEDDKNMQEAIRIQSDIELKEKNLGEQKNEVKKIIQNLS